jgi:hypothetical protein
MTDSFTSGYSSSGDSPLRGGGATFLRAVLPEDTRRGAARRRPKRIVVGIFSLSSHSVITVIMVWIAWTMSVSRAATDG